MVKIYWWHVTRTIGTLVFLYGVFLDDSAERGTIILTGAGLAGFDKVARTETPHTKKDDTDNAKNVK